MSCISADIITDEKLLAALAPDWLDLWNRSSNSLPFQAPGWLIPWWRHFSPGTLFVLAAHRDGRLVGLAPGYVEDGPLGRRILPLGISLSDHLDILVDPECSEGALRVLAEIAAAHGDAWDIWELEELPPGAAALRLPLPSGHAERIELQSACPVLSIPAGAGDLSAVLPRRKRQHLNLARNRCARRGAVRIDRAEDGGALPALEQLFRLHGKRWTMRGEEGVLSSDSVRAFQREAVPQLDRAGLLRLYVLSIGGGVVAVYYALVHRRCAYLYLTGFDPEHDFASPGVLLTAYAIEQAIAEGCREIDFLRGREAYKYTWGAVDRWNSKRSIFRVGHG